MRVVPEARNGRFLAAVLLLIVLMLAYLLGLHWWFVAPQLEIADQMNDLRTQQHRFAELAAQRPMIEKRLAQVRRDEQSNQGFLGDADSNTAFSDLTQRLKQAIAAHAQDDSRCAIVSNSNYRGGEEELYERVTIQVRMRCTLEPFAGILYDLENSKPYLFVDQLMIYRQQRPYFHPGKQPNVATTLDIRFNLSGYLRQPGKKTR